MNETNDAITSNATLEGFELPLMPLREVVMSPHSIMPLLVGREASIKAIESAVNDYGKRICLVTQREPELEKPDPADLYAVGVVGRVLQYMRLPEGPIKVLFEGLYRISWRPLTPEDQENPFGTDAFPKVVVTPLPIMRNDGPETEALVRATKEILAEYAHTNKKLTPEILSAVSALRDPGQLADTILPLLKIEYPKKQEALELADPGQRLEKVYEFLNTEMERVSMERRIKSRVKDQMDKNQRDYYLREQMHIISEELGDAEDTRAEAEKYAQKIQDLHLDAASEEKLLKECERLGKMAGNQAEISVIRSYLDTVIGLPWHTFTKDDLNQAHARKVLDHDHYGLEKVKERILEILAVRQLNTDVKGQIICLVGPPGVGKTSIARSVAACMGRNFARMSLGGVHDEAEIRGHRRTYIGALPGRIISAINTAKSSNPVILLDEIDKLAGDYRGDPSSALLEVLDPEQNKTFKDNYLDIPFDLSNVLFITTANDASHIPGPLYDRMDVIELPSYTRVEKFNIARRHLLPKQLKNNGLESRATMAPAALYEIIDGYTREAGVRTLERTITAVLRKCAQKIAAGEKDKINVTPAMVKAMLGPEKVKPTFISRTDAVGIANGLAWTSVGGEMLPIEVSIIPNGSGKVEITGSLGDVMKESAHLALTYARVHAETYHIAPDKFKNTDIHIHAPEGAVPKDGPSAGVTLTTALISALSEIPVRHDLAMTGEITLHGNVLPIGGLKEKSMAAFREGISTVLIPEANKPDLYEVDEEVKKAVKFIPVSDLSQVLKHALILPAASAAHKRTMPQATQLIATEQSTAKEPAAVM